jgi:hypothetical protein
MSGTSVGMLNNYNGSRWPQQSYFDLLRRHNRTFGAYYQDNLWYAQIKPDIAFVSSVESHDFPFNFDLQGHW